MIIRYSSHQLLTSNHIRQKYTISRKQNPKDNHSKKNEKVELRIQHTKINDCSRIQLNYEHETDEVKFKCLQETWKCDNYNNSYDKACN